MVAIRTIKMIAIKHLLICGGIMFCLQNAAAGIPIQRWILPSGAQVNLVESPAIPMVDIQIDFDAGGRRDPSHQAGLASVTAGMAGKGLTGQKGLAPMDENELGEAWADLGASFGASAGSDRMSFALRSLTEPDLLAKALALAGRQMAEPAFASAIWARERQRLIASLAEAARRPGTLAGKEFGRAVYGPHPYGMEMTEASLSAISVADMQNLYRLHILPCRAKISVVGNLNRAQTQAAVQALLAGLPSAAGQCAALPLVSEVTALTQSREINLPFESAQAHVLIGQPGFKRDDPDFFLLTVGNYILGGGGFVSRLTSEVREKRGLSYSVYSYFSPGLHAGAFTVGLQTRPDQAQQAVHVAKQVVADFVSNGPTPDELQAAKDNLIGGFALLIDSNRKLLGNVANIAWNGLPLDYLDTWTAQVDRVTVHEIKAAFARKLQPDSMVTVIVGGKP